jgi:PIN domain nuclease of toxin-antitoxin system
VKFLLDTHTFLWLESDPAQLSATAAATLADPNNIPLLSYASVWEIQIKVQIGKLQITTPLTTYIQAQQQTNQLVLLPIELRHIFALDRLPLHHRDPFDRLLIAQSLSEGIPILSRDSMFSRYPLKVIW